MKKLARILGVFMALTFSISLAFADELIDNTKDLMSAIMTAQDGDTILVSDIEFSPMPKGMVLVSKSIKIESGLDRNAIFTNATIALNGTTNDANPLTVIFENIDFKGDQDGKELDNSSEEAVSSQVPSIMKTMCAGIFKMNVNATYLNCNFSGYHYGYGGVFNAIYSSDDNKNELKINLVNCKFQNNQGKYGGAIYLSGRNHNIKLRALRCEFSNNMAVTGEAIYANQAEVELIDCNVSNNTFMNLESIDTTGAIRLIDCKSDIDGCSIINNETKGLGGGLSLEISPFDSCTIKNSTILNNMGYIKNDIAIKKSYTNFDAEAVAHIYFSSIGEILGDYDGYFISFLSDEEEMPKEDNNYCGKFTELSADSFGHYHTSAIYEIPEDYYRSVANGMFKNSLGKLNVGDNFNRKIKLKVDNKDYDVYYGDLLQIEPLERRGFQFIRFEYPKGTPLNSNLKYMGGEVEDAKVYVKWKFEFSENIHWFLIIALVLVSIYVIMKKKKAPLDDGAWVDRVLNDEDIIAKLSNRELDVLKLLLLGKTGEEISKELFISESTVKKHSSSIYEKLDVSSKAELISKMAKR